MGQVRLIKDLTRCYRQVIVIAHMGQVRLIKDLTNIYIFLGLVRPKRKMCASDSQQMLIFIS